MRKLKTIIQKSLFVKKGSDKTITFAMLLLALIGMVMTTSTSVGMERTTVAVAWYLVKQSGIIIMGLLLMNLTSNLFRFSFVDKRIFELSLFMIFFLFIPLGFTAVNGAKAWIRLPGGMSIQPAEFFKIFLIILIAVCFEKIRTKNITFLKAFIPVFTFGGAGLFIIIFLQRDMGTAMIVLLLISILLMIPYHPNFTKKQALMFKLAIIFSIIVFFLLTNLGLDLIINLNGGLESNKYQVLRFVAARNPFLDAQGSGLQLIYGLEAIARGGLFGVGVGNSTVKFLIPEGRTDYIITIIMEEIGLVGFLFITFLMLLIVGRLIYFALRSKNESYKVILLGGALYFLFHYILNVGGVSGLIPLTGIPLLMVSSGGTSLLAVFIGIGICQGLISVIKRDMNIGGKWWE